MNLTGAQSALLDRLVAVVEQVPGVEAIWLSGSLAGGEGDEFSDVDLHAAINGEAPGDELELWRDVARSAGAVFARATPGPRGILVNAVTGDGSRFDLVIHASSHLSQGLAGPIRPLRDNAGLLAAVPISTAQAGPGPGQVTAWTEEFLRSLLLLSVVGPRGEWISAEIGSLWMLSLLKDLMLAENGEAGAGSALRLGRRLNEEQRAVLLRLPPLTANERDVTRFQAALANEFLPRARRLCRQLGAAYPEEFEAAVRRRIGDRLTRALIGGDRASQ